MTPIDTGPLVALIDAAQPTHSLCKAQLRQLSRPLLTPYACITEAMYLLHRIGGWYYQALLWEYITQGVLQIDTPPPGEEHRCRQLMEQYRDAPMDFADAALVALCERLNLPTIFTLDSHFYAYRLHGQQPFQVIP